MAPTMWLTLVVRGIAATTDDDIADAAVGKEVVLTH